MLLSGWPGAGSVLNTRSGLFPAGLLACARLRRFERSRAIAKGPVVRSAGRARRTRQTACRQEHARCRHDRPAAKSQAERFHGYYDHYCYLPLYVFCGEHVLCARLRPSNSDASTGSLAEIERIVDQIREAWPAVKIILRRESEFCRNELMSWCENKRVDYVVGLARNQRLRGIIGRQMWEATEQWNQTASRRECSPSSLFRLEERRNEAGIDSGAWWPKPSILMAKRTRVLS